VSHTLPHHGSHVTRHTSHVTRQFATEAALTILRIDDLIKLDPKPAADEDH
jgi:hypothetical protein